VTAFPPKLPLCRLYEKTSARGTQYFQGRLGAAKVVLLKSQEVTERGEPIWELSVQEPAAQPAAKTVAPQPALFRAPTSRRREVLSGPDLPADVSDLWPGGAP
jgi:hypothetical protein